MREGAAVRAGTAGARASVTAVILTFNEEANIRACIEAIPSGVPVMVVDSFSTDRTLEIAAEMGATVSQRRWSGFADQRNFALQGCGLATEWALFVDADERYPAAFFTWMDAAIAADPPTDAYEVPSLLVLDGHPLRRAPGYPVLHPRLVRRSAVSFRVNHAGHGEALEPCRTALAPIGYDHFFQSGDLTPWLSKHVQLASMEAAAAGAPTTRRGKVSRWAPRGPTRALIRFLYHYVFRLGLLDGPAGFRYAVMYAWYDLTIYLIRASR